MAPLIYTSLYRCGNTYKIGKDALIGMCICIQWNLSALDILGPDIFGSFPLSEVKNVMVTPVGTKNFCPYYRGFFYCVLNSGGLLREIPLYVLVYACLCGYLYTLLNLAMIYPLTTFHFICM